METRRAASECLLSGVSQVFGTAASARLVTSDIPGSGQTVQNTEIRRVLVTTLAADNHNHNQPRTENGLAGLNERLTRFSNALKI